MKLMSSLSLAFLLTLPAFAQEDASSIVLKHKQAMLKELRAYIAANPDAEDREHAVQVAMETAFDMEELDTVIALAKDMYAEISRGPDAAEFDRNLAGTVQLIVQMYIEKGDRRGAMDFLENAVADARKREDVGPALAGVFEQAAGLLVRPVKGDTLELTGTTLAGDKFDMATLKGKWVVVKFWATWCGPCLNEMPAFFDLGKKYRDGKFEIVTISLDRSEIPLNAYIESNDMPWVHLMDSAQAESIADKYGINAIPANFLIGPDGKVHAANVQPHEIAAILAENLGGQDKDPSASE